MDMVPEPTLLPHGGDLSAARRQFPGAAEPFIDLSTGINPHPYPVPELSSELFARLPQQDALARLLSAAAEFYTAPSPAHVVAAPGTQMLLPAIASLMPRGRVRVLGPTYAEHLRVASLAGHDAAEAGDLAQLEDADLAVVVNPNNPDGRLLTRGALLAVAGALQARGGILIVDEAFMDVAPPAASLAADATRGNIVVLRSFGKFFGLAGLRLGFAIAAPATASRVGAWLGPWAVSAPAMAIGEAALTDIAWTRATREMLGREAHRLDQVLTGAGLAVVGGTALFRLVRTPAAGKLFDHLGRCGLLVRRFAGHPQWLRFGLPSDEQAWGRLSSALSAFSAPLRQALPAAHSPHGKRHRTR
jgi:cobalamin biosynthetic protein CobC